MPGDVSPPASPNALGVVENGGSTNTLLCAVGGCPFCQDNGSDEETDVKQRRRRQMERERNRLKLSKWWKSYGYNGPKYCQRCSEVFRDHIMRQLSNSARCIRQRPCTDCKRVLEWFPQPASNAYERIDQIGKRRDAKTAQKKLGAAPTAGTCSSPLVLANSVEPCPPGVKRELAPPPITLPWQTPYHFVSATKVEPTDNFADIMLQLSVPQTMETSDPAATACRMDTEPPAYACAVALPALPTAALPTAEDVRIDSGYSSSSSDSDAMYVASSDWLSVDGSWTSAAVSGLDEPITLESHSDGYLSSPSPLRSSPDSMPGSPEPIRDPAFFDSSSSSPYRSSGSRKRKQMHAGADKPLYSSTDNRVKRSASVIAVSSLLGFMALCARGYTSPSLWQRTDTVESRRSTCIGGAAVNAKNVTCRGYLGDECQLECLPEYGLATPHVCTTSGKFEGGSCGPCPPYGVTTFINGAGICQLCQTCPLSQLTAVRGACTSIMDTFCPGEDWMWLFDKRPAAPQNSLGPVGPETWASPPVSAFAYTWRGANGALWLQGGWTLRADGEHVARELWSSPLSGRGERQQWRRVRIGVPPATVGGLSWTDDLNGLFYIFGGTTLSDGEKLADHFEDINPMIDSLPGVTVDGSIDMGAVSQWPALENETVSERDARQNAWLRHRTRSGHAGSNELWCFDGFKWEVIGGRQSPILDAWLLTMSAKLDGGLFIDHTTMIDTWQGPVWPQGRSFGIAWQRNTDVLMFGGLVTVRYFNTPNVTGKWLLNDLWQYDKTDVKVPWKLLGGSGLARWDWDRWDLDSPHSWPSPRMHAAGWISSDGHGSDTAWMFGGVLGCCQGEVSRSPRDDVAALSSELWTVSGTNVSLFGPMISAKNVMATGLKWAQVKVFQSDHIFGSGPGMLRPTGGASGVRPTGSNHLHDPTMSPLPRAAPTTWHDMHGRPWMFGGVDTANKCDLNDLWTIDGSETSTPRWLLVTNRTDMAWPKPRFGASKWFNEEGAIVFGGAAIGRPCNHDGAPVLLDGHFPVTDHDRLMEYQRLPRTPLQTVDEKAYFRDQDASRFESQTGGASRGRHGRGLPGVGGQPGNPIVDRPYARGDSHPRAGGRSGSNIPVDLWDVLGARGVAAAWHSPAAELQPVRPDEPAGVVSKPEKSTESSH